LILKSTAVRPGGCRGGILPPQKTGKYKNIRAGRSYDSRPDGRRYNFNGLK